MSDQENIAKHPNEKSRKKKNHPPTDGEGSKGNTPKHSHHPPTDGEGSKGNNPKQSHHPPTDGEGSFESCHPPTKDSDGAGPSGLCNRSQSRSAESETDYYGGEDEEDEIQDRDFNVHASDTGFKIKSPTLKRTADKTPKRSKTQQSAAKRKAQQKKPDPRLHL